ncbi:hypothetical protein [Niveibacterium sp. SC-1]|uniref:hypothetical protein n=1 Tax=Niveibacterium sp. SC-1 TaxID=3135646 RepID=UPI00311F936D
MSIRIDFSRTRRHTPWPWLVALALAGWAAWLGLQYRDTQAELLRVRGESARVAAAQARRAQAAHPEPIRVAPERVRAINAAIGQLNVPWLDLTEALEAVRPEGITLLAMQPDATHSTLLIVAEADRAEMLADYAQALAARPPFRRYTPVKQNQVTALGKPRLQLSFELEWAS